MSDAPPPPPTDETLNENEIDLNTNIDLSSNNTNNNDSEIVNSKKLTTSGSSKPNDDLFFSTISDPEPVNEQKKMNEDMDEIFRLNKPEDSRATKEIKLDEDDDDPFSFSNNSRNSANNSFNQAPTNKVAPPSPSTNQPPAAINIQPVISSQKSQNGENSSNVSNSASGQDIENLSSSLNKQSLQASNSLFTNNIEEDDEERDKFIEITLSDPSKVGDGMSSYMVYKITTKTNIQVFRSKEFSANRRFSDFLNLYEKLKEKHLPAGRILPPAPEKDMIGMAKVKMSKEDTTPIDFIEKRRAALQRFLNRLANHKKFRYDPDFRDFLEISEDLPKATNTSALSGANVLKMFKNVTDSVSKIALKMEETDQWFEEKSRQVDNLYVQYKKMHAVAELLYGWRKDLATSTKDFSKSISILANAEEQLSLSRALSQLGEIYEKIDQIYLDESNSDYFMLAELVKDYVCLFDNIKEVFYQRVKTFSNWQKAEEALKVKKDAKAKLEATNKQDKIPTVAAEIKDLEGKVEKAKEEFEQISKTIKEEIKRFDLNRATEFRNELTKYLQALLTNQETIVKIWEQYMPEVKAI